MSTRNLTAYSSSSDEEEVTEIEIKPIVATEIEIKPIIATEIEIKPTVASIEGNGAVWGTSQRTTGACTCNTTIKGYVSKRKATVSRAAVDAPCKPTEGSQLVAVKDYLYSITDGPEAKRARKAYGIPRTTRVVLSEHSKATMDIHWHPFQSQLLLSASLDGTVKLWDANEKGKCIATYDHHGSGVRAAKWIENSKIVSGGYDKCCKYMNIETGQIISSFEHTGFVTSMNVHFGNKDMVVTGDINGNVQSWDLRSGRKNGQFLGAGGSILSIEFLHNGKEFIATSDIVRKNAASQAVVVWDIASTAVLSNQVYIEPYTCPCIKAHPEEPYILAQSNGNYIVLFSSNRPYKLNKYKRYEGHTVEGFNVGFDISPDGRLLCSGSADGRIYFYDYYSSKLLKSVPLGKSPTLAVAVHPSLHTTVAVSNWIGSVSILD